MDMQLQRMATEQGLSIIPALQTHTKALIHGLVVNDNTGVALATRELRKKYYDPHCQQLSLDKGILKEGLVLQTLVDAFDERSVITLVSKLIKNFCAQFNVSKNMTEQQCNNFAIEIVMEESNKWRLEELVVFFERAAAGQYGRRDGRPAIFDRIDKQVIGQMMDDYFSTDRTEAKYAIEEDKKNELMKDVIPVGRSYKPEPLGDKVASSSRVNAIIPGITSPEKKSK